MGITGRTVQDTLDYSHFLEVNIPIPDLHKNFKDLLLNFNFGGNWAGQTSHSDSSIVNFQREEFEVDYCRIYTNTNANNTISREPATPQGAPLSGPVSM